AQRELQLIQLGRPAARGVHQRPPRRVTHHRQPGAIHSGHLGRDLTPIPSRYRATACSCAFGDQTPQPGTPPVSHARSPARASCSPQRIPRPPALPLPPLARPLTTATKPGGCSRRGRLTTTRQQGHVAHTYALTIAPPEMPE